MMMKKNFILIAFVLILAACSTTKNIPEGQYLLEDFKVEHDTKNATADLESFVRQEPNSSIPLLGKVRLGIYNSAGQDTSKWLTRVIRKLGQAPVLYSANQTVVSRNQLLKELNNQGYLNAEADTTLKIKGKKISVTYNLKSNTPYTIRNYSYTIADTTMARIMSKVPLKPLLKKGDMFDKSMLEAERVQVNTIMRNVGYYNFSKEYVYFKADTTLNSHEVDLYMDVYQAKDSMPYPRYKLNKITVISGIQPTDNLSSGAGGRINTSQRFFRNPDTTYYGGLEIIRGRNHFLRSSSIKKNNYLRTGSYYSDNNVTKTYEAYSKMKAIKQVNIATMPSPGDSTHLLDATILLLPANVHWFKAALDGTNSAGDIGVAPSVSYQHQNLFNGGEQLNISLKGAYEFIGGSNSADLVNQSYYEYGAESSLSFPLFLFPWLKKSWREQPSAATVVSLGFNNQHRPEYTRQFFNASLNYNWMSKKNTIRHGLDILDINYILMPWMSQKFQDDYINDPDNALLRESYSDQFVARTAYTTTFTNGKRLNPLYPTYTIRTSIELAGVLPRLMTTIGGADKDSLGQKKILGVAYAEYIKGSVDYSRTFYFSKKHSVAYHALIGMAQPYGNSDILPFERRFFAGGSNSIRGWSTRTLGPGSYKRATGEDSDFVNQAGDMKFEVSIENRNKFGSMFEFAEFIDAGNIWTLKNYEEQPGGQFKLSEFYKEIAVSYGIGLRLDLSFLLVRFDTGMKAYDPGLDQSDRFVLFKPTLNRMALHFGIGYPF